jgi:hypothetical protein
MNDESYDLSSSALLFVSLPWEAPISIGYVVPSDPSRTSGDNPVSQYCTSFDVCLDADEVGVRRKTIFWLKSNSEASHLVRCAPRLRRW